MITYDDLAATLEDAWVTAGLHDHTLEETVRPESMERVYKATLFPEHEEPLMAGNEPPWVEVSFVWTAEHQLRADGRAMPPPALELTWVYTLHPRGLDERPDPELARMFLSAVRSAMRRAVPDIPVNNDFMMVEVRRGFHGGSDRLLPAFVQLVGTSITDLAELWDQYEPDSLEQALQVELSLVAGIIHALSDMFMPRANGNTYRPVDTA